MLKGLGKPALDAYMNKQISGIGPLFIVNNVPAAVPFYHDRPD
jgi:hypothetical protein